MWGGCGLHPNDMSFFFFCVCIRVAGAGGGVLSLMCESSWPSPLLLSLHSMRCVCASKGMCAFTLCGSGGDTLLMCVCLHACCAFTCMCVCVMVYGVSIPVCCMCMCEVGKAVVSHPHASIACYHGSHTASTPPPHVLLLFFNLTNISSLSSSSSSYISSSSFSSLTHRWLPHHHQWHHHSLPSTLLWWIILYVEIFSLLLSSTSQQGKPECQPIVRKMRRSSVCLWRLGLFSSCVTLVM